MSFLSSIRSLCHFLCHAPLDRIALLILRRPRSDAVAIVKVDGIGDFVVWLGSARLLRRHYKDRRVIAVVNANCVDLAISVGYFDEVVAVDVDAFRSSFVYRFTTMKLVRSLGAAIVIQPTYSRQYWIGDSLVRATAAPDRIGSQCDLHNIRPWQRKISNNWYTQLIAAKPVRMPELVRNAKFLEGLGIGDGRPRMTSLGKVADLPPAIPIERDYFIVFPGAGSPKRKWPAERFAEAARSIAEQTGLQLLICGSAGEAALAQEVINLSGLLDALQLAGRTTMPEFVELVRGARLLIGNETSAVHVAAAVGTPSICLLGGGHFNRFVPYPESVQGIKPHPVYHAIPCYGCDWRCNQPHQTGGPVPCIASIGVAGVIQAALVLASREERVECLQN